MTSIEGQTASRWRALERSVEMLWQFYAGSEVGVVEAAVHALVGGEAARACKQSLLATERVHRFQSAEALQVRLSSVPTVPLVRGLLELPPRAIRGANRASHQPCGPGQPCLVQRQPRMPGSPCA